MADPSPGASSEPMEDARPTEPGPAWKRQLVEAEVKPKAKPLRFASWNVLGDTNLRNNVYLYKDCVPGALQNRAPRILEGLVRLNADVIALQEVEDFDRDYLAPMAQAGMDGVFKQRTGDGQVDGVALLWRSSRLKPLLIDRVSNKNLKNVKKS